MTQNKMIGPTNELAKERNRAAAERTMTAWIQNCLTLIGFGFAIDQIFQALQQKFPDKSPLITIQSAHYISLVLIAMGIVLLIIAMIQHYFEVQSIKRDDYFFYPSHYLNIIVVSAIIIFGLMSLLIIFLGIG
ncbi:YidH family protein [Cyanothece sp. BG0011]|uniref:YidH family protein n=1 Tax=Cyanothece sp. BG0011 TaxID=2082950 RepID=UPI000D1F56EA|nr:DUF202 domain-containing protein [Cyanothece sp. BG0011]